MPRPNADLDGSGNHGTAERMAAHGEFEDARELAYPRYPGSEGDARAIGWVAGKLSEAGLEVSRQEFSYDIRQAFRALRLLLSGGAVLVAGAGLLAARSPAGAAALLLAALIAGAVFLGWAPWMEALYRSAGPTRTSPTRS